MNTNEQTEIILMKYMLGEADEQEQQQVQQWLAQDGANLQYYHQLQTIWQQSKQLEEGSKVDEEDAWKRFKQKVGTNTGPAAARHTAGPLWRMNRAAAILVLLVAGGWLLYQAEWRNGAITLTAGNAVVTDTLPDGSVITLNKNALLRYNKKMAEKENRDVTLQGEAFFDIAANKNKPFIITAGDVTIKVLGTSFNVKRTPKATEIIVASGAVEVIHNSHTVRLHQQEKVVITQNESDLQKQQNSSELYSYYRTKQFVCKGTPLYQLVQALNEAYQADIVIGNDAIKSLPITTTFQQQSLDSITSIISKTLGVQVVKQKQQIILK